MPSRPPSAPRYVVVAGLLRDAIIAGQGYVEALRLYWRARTELELLLAGHLRDAA